MYTAKLKFYPYNKYMPARRKWSIMNLFSDIYNCYYQVMKKILTERAPFSEKDIRSIVEKEGFKESPFFIMPKIMSGEWDFFIHKGDIFISKLKGGFAQPLSYLQKCYISALLLDEKIQLFFNKKELAELKNMFAAYKPLWKPEDFYYYDRFADKDSFTDPYYINIFQTILSAIKNRQCIQINYKGKNSTHMHSLLPCRLEYSLKNDRIRMVAVPMSCFNLLLNTRIETYNLCNICSISILGRYTGEMPDINKAIIKSYYKEPVHLLIKDRRNALERTMLQFANYEKNTVQIDEETYECFIYYNKNVETELLIEVLSFGPLIKVLGNQEFLEQLKRRLKKQGQLMK